MIKCPIKFVDRIVWVIASSEQNDRKNTKDYKSLHRALIINAIWLAHLTGKGPLNGHKCKKKSQWKKKKNIFYIEFYIWFPTVVAQ